MGIKLKLILSAYLVNFGLLTFVQTQYQFQNSFHSVVNNADEVEMYHGIVKEGIAKEQDVQAFNTMAEELQIARSKNTHEKRTGEAEAVVIKRQVGGTSEETTTEAVTVVKKIEVSTEWWTGIYENNKTITYEGIISLFRAKTGYVIDVRTRKEINETGLIIPSSVNIPLNELQDALNLSYQDFPLKYGRDKAGLHSTVIFVCRSGRRSALAVRVASAMGYTNPYNYVGGLLDWEKHKLAENEMNINWPWWDGPK